MGLAGNIGTKLEIVFSGKKWKLLSRNLVDNKKDLVGLLCDHRNIKNLDEISNISLKEYIPEPYSFKDMEQAVETTVNAIKNHKKIVIFGDYDVDGVSSTSILIKFFNAIGIQVIYHIPNRFLHGYGVNKENISKYADYLIIAVDCGSSSFDELRFANEIGAQIIVIDHHKMKDLVQPSALVNPHRPDENPKILQNYGNFCAAALVFMYVIALNRYLRNDNFYVANDQYKEPFMKDFLDLVALATVCDVMFLSPVNKALVIAGINIIANTKNLGISCLLKFFSGIEINSETIGFFLGPRINAAGRIKDASLSVQLLTTDDEDTARKLALQLNMLNEERKQIESQMLQMAESMIDHNLNFICLYDSSWHIGVIGIVAGRLKEKYKKPVMIISKSADGVGKASCRSVSGIDMSCLIASATETKVLISGGGHELSAGFSIALDKISDFIEFLKCYAPLNSESLDDGTFEGTVECLIDPNCVNVDFISAISMFEPFGNGNERPRFILPNLLIHKYKIVGEKHIQITFKTSCGIEIRAIKFNAVFTPIENIIKNNVGLCVAAICALSISNWNAKKYVSLQIEDLSERDFIDNI